MRLFTTDGSSYDGMDQDTVTRLRTELGRDTTYVDEATYLAFLAANQPTRGI